MDQITENLARVRQRIRQAAESAGRDPAGIRLLAVSKTRPAAEIRAAMAAGQYAFGENYLQDAEPKIRELSDC
ncbi:MAG: YggS family pyridoxal phosphate enzyme, partial [Gammaproteobacteria bacterium]